MPVLPLLLAAAIAQDTKPITIKPPASRFEYASPLKGIPPVMADTYNDGMGLAQQMARAKGLQARILWVDATANIDKTNSEEKIVALMQQIKRAGFNTVVYDIKPISGHLMYPSSLAPKMQEWKGKTMPLEFDPVKYMVREAKAQGMPIYFSLNAFSEGHALFKVGPGYERQQNQTVIYDAQPLLMVEEDRWFEVSPKPNVLALEGAGLTLFTDVTKLPKPAEGSFAVTLGKDMVVMDGFEMGGPLGGTPTLPAGGSIVYGKGAGADFLKTYVEPGKKVRFDTIPKFVPISSRPEQQYPLMMNPNDPAVQDHALAVIREATGLYQPDGVIYDDRLRYGGMNADFSVLSTSMFEQYVGKKLRWPDDVFKYTVSPKLVRGLKPGPYFEAWMVWRALQLRNWVGRVRQEVTNVKPDAQFGVYAGSWYGEYPQYGNNYASPDLEAGFWFLTPAYRKTGFANLLDFLVTGCYYPNATIYQAMSEGLNVGATVESAGQLTNRVARDECWSYAGIMLSQFKDDPEGLCDALQAACASTQGVMVFDLSHEIEPFWPVFQRAFSVPAKPPHKSAQLKEVRRLRKIYDKLGAKGHAVPIQAGSSGTGF